jgi:hypothetical protein
MQGDRAVRCRWSHIFYTIGSQMVVRLSALCASRALPKKDVLVLISIRGWVNVRAIGLGKLKKSNDFIWTQIYDLYMFMYWWMCAHVYARIMNEWMNEWMNGPTKMAIIPPIPTHCWHPHSVLWKCSKTFTHVKLILIACQASVLISSLRNIYATSQTACLSSNVILKLHCRHCVMKYLQRNFITNLTKAKTSLQEILYLIKVVLP